MSLRFAISQNRRPLTPSETRVIGLLMQDVRETVFLPAAEVARQAGVHESTVIRLAQKLGFEGYAELREAMRTDIKELDFSPARLVKLTDVRGYNLAALVEAEARALLRLPDHVSQADLEEIAQLLLDADHVFFYGNHYALPLMDYLDRRLRVIGGRTSVINAAGRDLAEHVAPMRRGDVLFVFALRREPPAYGVLVDRALRQGIMVIAITDEHGLAISPPPTKLVVAPRGVDEDFRTQAAPHLVCYAMLLAMNRIAPERCEAGFAEVESLERQLVSSNGRAAPAGARRPARSRRSPG